MDEAAEIRFTALADEVGPALRRYVVRRVTASQVDDVLADVMLVLWRRLADVPRDEPLPWCYGVARRCVQNASRSSRRQVRLAERVLAEPAAPAPPEDPDLETALARLTTTEQELIRLWAWEGLPPREIAVVTGLSANAVSIRLHRAKARLAGFLDEERGSARKSAGASGHESGERRAP